jgi:hypothetical protein
MAAAIVIDPGDLGEQPMKALLALAMLAALATVAVATPSPYKQKPVEPASDDSALYLGLAGAALESDYFGMPRPSLGAMRVFPCRVRLRPIAGEPRFAQVCD